MTYYVSRRRSYLSSLSFEWFGMGLVAAILSLVILVGIFQPADNSFVWKDNFTIPFSGFCVVAMAWWGWYSARLATRYIAKDIVRNMKNATN